MCDGHDHDHDHDSTDASIELMDAHQKRIEPYWRAAFKMPAPRAYESGTLVWMVDHYNTGRVDSEVGDPTGKATAPRYSVETTDADGKVMRGTYSIEQLRPATVEHVFRWSYTLRGHGSQRRVHVTGAPRKISGGYVVEVAWVDDDDSQKLPDGTVHPAHRAGYSWEEPTLNVNGYRPA